MESWLLVFTFFSVAIGSIFSIVLLFFKKSSVAIRLLGLYTLTLSLGLAEPLLLPFLNESTMLFYGAFSFLYGPFLFLYTKYSASNFSHLKTREYFHFLPFMMYLFLIATSIVLPVVGDLDIPDLILYELLFFQIFFYCTKSLYFLKALPHLVSAPDKRVGMMKQSFLYAINICSTVLFLSSFLGSHLLLFLGNQTLPSGFISFIQVAITLVILIVCLLNTETMTAKIIEPDDLE